MQRLLLTLIGSFAAFSVARGVSSFTLVNYNVAGNGTTDWSTNTAQVQAVGRQLAYLAPDVVTFVEIPFTNTWQMTNFVRAYLPGFFLATNSGTDGYIRSVVASRFPIVRSQKWLDGINLTTWGATNEYFARDLFEAELNVPDFTEHLHVFVTHLKASSDNVSALRRGAEAGAISNFFVNTFLPTKGNRPYVLSGDLNEDINDPPSTSRQPIQRLVNPATGLRLTTPANPVTGSERTYSIRNSSLSERIDYILPGGLLFSNILASQVFRSDRLTPPPSGLLTNDSKTASDHLPVMMTFHNPYMTSFRLAPPVRSNQFVRLKWETIPTRQYRLDGSTNFSAWTPLSSNLTAMTTNLSWSVPRSLPFQYFRVYRFP